MLFFSNARHRRPGSISAGFNRTHFRPQALDEMFDVERERRAAFHRDVSVESSGLGNSKEINAGIAAMSDGELIDDRDSKTCLDQRTDGCSETRPDGDVVGQFIAREYLGHDAPIGIVGVDSDEWVADHFSGGDLFPSREFMSLRHDAK